MTFAHVYNEIQTIQVKTHKSYIIKKRSNNKVSFVEFILNSRQFKLMTTGSQLHGVRWPRFNCVHMIETMSLAAAVAKKMIMSTFTFRVLISSIYHLFSSSTFIFVL